jgi:general secretion pathway protein D
MLTKSVTLCSLVWLALFSAAIAQGPSTNDASLKSYALQHKPVDEAQRLLAPLLKTAEGVKMEVDTSANRLLITGPGWAHEMAAQVLTTFDRPTSNPPPQPAATAGWSLKIYECPAGNQPAVQTKLQELFPGDQFAFSANPTEQVIYVRAPAQIHQQLGEWLKPVELGPAMSAPPMANFPANSRSNLNLPPDSAPANLGQNETQKSPSIRRLISVPPELNDRLRREMLQLLGEKIQPDVSDPTRLRLTTPSGVAFIQINTRSEWLIEGPEIVVDQLLRLVSSLMRRVVPFGEQQEKILLLRRDVQPRLKEIMTPPAALHGTDPAVHSTPDRQGNGNIPKSFGLKPVRFASWQDGAAGQPPAGAENLPTIPQFEGIEVETLPDLDAIILRGRDRELKQLAEIIEQLEQISRQTQPMIDLVILNHASSTQINSVITETQENLLGARQGRAQVTALAKPNALLIIGWGEAVKALKELIGKLDQPVLPETQFEVFRLKHAQATTLEQSLQEFLGDRGDLGPVIQSTVDSRTNSIVVHASPRDLDEVRRLVASLDIPQSNMVQRARVFPIQNSLAADVAQTLEAAITQSTSGTSNAALELFTETENGNAKIVSGILENTQITVNARNNSLIISAPQENFSLIEELIRQLDSPGMTASIKIFPIENGDATSLVQTLRSLLPSQVGPGSVSQLSSAPSESSLAPLRFTVDVRSNSIIATGSEGDLKIVEALVMRLDEADVKQRRSLVYQLKNAPATDVALAINEFLRNKRQVETAGPGSDNPFAQLEKEVIVVPEPVANKLILSATPKYFDEIKELIEKLDEQPPQVMIQVLIAEVMLGDAREFGVELGIQDSVLFDRSLLGNLETTTSSSQQSTPSGIVTNTQQNIVAATNEPGFNFNNVNPLGNSGSGVALGSADRIGGQGLSNFAVGRGNMELGFGGLVLSASSQNISILLRALQENKRMDILSRPQVLTLDNQPAFIQVGQRVPRITGSTVNQNGSQNNVELENVGLILGVTPRISPEGNVVMEIDAEKSSLGPEAEGIPVAVSLDGTIIRSPRVDTTTAQATVSAANGETIILGGLITSSKREVHRKVPVLGDIPVLKYLFSYDSVSDRRTELMIILTPHIIRSQDDAERVKQMELARMSWCAADVVNIHGDINMAPPPGSMIPEEGAWEVIYPDVDPRGESPRLQYSEPGIVEPAPTNPLPSKMEGAATPPPTLEQPVIPAQFMAPAQPLEGPR